MKVKQMILAALFAALTCIGTMIIKVPTPTGGYVHPGDGFVLLSGLLMGPIWGGLAAGLGSALADLLSGYVIYAPGTFVIKLLTAVVAALLFQILKQKANLQKDIASAAISGVAGEIVMVLGYFLYEIFLLSVVNHGTFSAGVIAAAAGVLPNLVQAIFGVGIATALYPLIRRLARE